MKILEASEAQPRTAEPQAIGAILKKAHGDQARDEFIAKWEAEKACDPDNTHTLAVCRICKSSLGTTEDDKVMAIGDQFFLPNTCCAACAVAGKKTWEDKDKVARDQAFAGIIPICFRTWDDAKGKNALRDRVLKLFSITILKDFRVSPPKGIVLHGPTGSGKTHLLWWLVRQVDVQGLTFLVCDSHEMATKGIPAEAEHTDVLCIDDLGNEPKTTKYESGLLHLLRKRLNWKRPTIITTQLTGAAFREQFFAGVSAEAVLRRLRDGSHMIDTSERDVANVKGATG